MAEKVLAQKLASGAQVRVSEVMICYYSVGLVADFSRVQAKRALKSLVYVQQWVYLALEETAAAVATPSQLVSVATGEYVELLKAHK